MVRVWCGFVVYRCHEGACGPHGCVRVGCACGCGSAETEAERDSQAKDNALCVWVWCVFFDHGSSEIKPESQPVLEQLIQVFGTFLYDSENAQYVDSIVISGHTDSTGTAMENRSLATDRANSVLNYMLTQHGGALEPYAHFFCAAGYGATRPVADNATVEGRAANRRIEISMILKDETVLDIVESYLAIEVPDTRSALGESEPVVAAEPQPTQEPSGGFAGILNWLG